MTTREWFRIQRAALWARDPSTAGDLDKVATAMTMGEWPQTGEYVRIGEFAWLESVQSYEDRQRLITQIRQDMEAAMRRLYYVGRMMHDVAD